MQVELWRSYDNYERRYTELMRVANYINSIIDIFTRVFPLNFHIQAPLEISMWGSIFNYY